MGRQFVNSEKLQVATIYAETPISRRKYVDILLIADCILMLFDAIQVQVQVQNVLYWIYYKETQVTKGMCKSKTRQMKKMHQDKLYTHTSWQIAYILALEHEFIYLNEYTHACMNSHMRVYIPACKYGGCSHTSKFEHKYKYHQIFRDLTDMHALDEIYTKYT